MARRRRWILVLLLALTAATSALAEEDDGEPGKETPVEPFGPWKVLGVSFGASDEVVRAAFKRLALIQPNLGVRTSGDLESKKGHKRVFTDRVLLDVPIAAMGPGGGPVVGRARVSAVASG